MHLSKDDIQDFMEYGYAVVKNAFTSEVAKDCRKIIWENICHYDSSRQIREDDPSTWASFSKVALDSVYLSDDGYPWNQVLTPVLESSIRQICCDTTSNPSYNPFGAGWWMITFPSSNESNMAKKWTVEGSWHIDGDNCPRFAYSHDVSVVLIMYFSDVNDNYGGTAVLEGSHLIACQHLIRHGNAGITKSRLVGEVLEDPAARRCNIIELTGRAGDVIILHPLLLHARSSNLAPVTLSGVRFMCHPSIGLPNSLCFTKPIDDMSILERTMLQAAKISSLEEKLMSISPQTQSTVTEDLSDSEDEMVQSLLIKIQDNVKKRRRY